MLTVLNPTTTWSASHVRTYALVTHALTLLRVVFVGSGRDLGRHARFHRTSGCELALHYVVAAFVWTREPSGLRESAIERGWLRALAATALVVGAGLAVGLGWTSWA